MPHTATSGPLLGESRQQSIIRGHFSFNCIGVATPIASCLTSWLSGLAEPSGRRGVDVRRLAAMVGRCWKARSGTARRSWIGPELLVLIFGVVASGCDWSLFGYDAANTRSSPDTGISTSSVGSLTESWTHAFGTGNGAHSHNELTRHSRS
jgi:hypothetical protein